uniref:VPS53Af n=1 Tax=Volvox carteri f. nagariensis TaxID=3068 RepID=D9CIV9_VOLCA|nr:VPS53Af [Volvox carteri f. nagariensis]
MASTPPRGAQIPGGAMASPPSGRTNIERRTSLEQQAKLQLQLTILRMPSCKRADLFDSEDFEPTKLINQLYPDESSLTDLDKFVTVLKKQIQQVDQEIFNAVRSQGGAHARARQDLTVAHGQIEELFTKIRDIQRKSEESEVTVQEICRDIKKLDYAKKHLTNSITALRRLAMLTAAVTDLEALCDRRDQYRKCANLVEAVHQLMEYFQQYEAISKVRSIALRLAAVEAKLQYAVLNDFKILIGGPANDGLKMPPENLERLATACLVVDVLGKEVQDQVMDWLCDREMSIYQSAFGGAVGMMVGATAAADDRGAAVAAAHATRLDKFEQRFVWFRERLKEKREVWGVFPQHWKVPQMLCLTFCKITKAHLKRILSDEEALAGLRSDVGPLLKAVVATNRFERDMAALFGGGGGRQGAGGGADDGDDDSDPGGGGGADSMSASEARRRLEKFRARMKAEQQAARAAKDQQQQQQAGTAVARAGDRVREAREEVIKEVFEGAVSGESIRWFELLWYIALASISEAFEGVLVQYYVDQEERELLEALDGAVREEVERRWLPDEEEGVVTGRGTRVLQSANKIFFRIRASLTRCSKNVSRGPTLVALAQLFRRVLSGYAAELMRRLPKTAAGGTSANPAVVGGSTHCCTRMYSCFLIAPCSQPCCPSASHVRLPLLLLPGQVLLDCAPPLGAGLEAANLSFMCDKVARMFVPRLREAIFRLRRVADGGMMQLAIDMDAVRRSLLEFPRVARSASELVGAPHGAAAAAAGVDGGGRDSSGGAEQQQHDQDLPAFTTYVEREMGHVVALVKVLQSRPEQLVDNYLLLMPPAAQSLMEFQRLCDLKSSLFQGRIGSIGSGGDPTSSSGTAGGGTFAVSFPSATAASTPTAAAAGAFFKETAAKTKEGFARFGNFIRVANALTGINESAGSGGGGGGGGEGMSSSSHH